MGADVELSGTPNTGFRERQAGREGGLVDRHRRFSNPQVESIRPLNQPAAANFDLRYRKLAIRLSDEKRYFVAHRVVFGNDDLRPVSH